MNSAGGDVVRLTFSASELHEPDWSSDGVWITFADAAPTGSADIMAVRRDGTGLIRLTDGSSFNRSPAWVPQNKE